MCVQSRDGQWPLMHHVFAYLLYLPNTCIYHVEITMQDFKMQTRTQTLIIDGFLSHTDCVNVFKIWVLASGS